MKPVLLLSAGGFQGLGMLQALQGLSAVRPIIADIHADNVTRYLCSDYHVVPPLSDADGFRSALLDLVRAQSVTDVIPCSARELVPLARMRGELECIGARVAVSPAALLDELLDKHRTARFLARHGIAAQVEIDPHAHDFTAAPLFGRPLAGWGGLGTQVLRTAAERDRAEAREELAGCTWSVLIESFDEYSADFAVRTSGECSPICLRRRVRTSGGYAVISESACDAAIASLARSVAMAIAGAEGRGFFNVQIIRPCNGASPMVSDVNPRMGTSFGHCLAEGMNMAGFYLGIDAQSTRPRRPAKTVRTLRDLSIQRLPRRPAAVVFDLDDTLIDHKRWMAAKALCAYDAVAADWCSRELFLLDALGLIDEGERRHYIDRLCDRLDWDTARHAAFLAAFREARVETPVHEDVIACLSTLRAHGLKLALLTDNPPATQQQKIDAAHGLPTFDATIFARETGAEKPDPRAFLAAAAALDMDPGDVCMVGDNLFRDCLGALRAGYGAAILLQRDGAFLQSNRALSRMAGVDAEPRIARAPDLIVAREILLGS